MPQQSDQRPEGIRTHPRVTPVWMFVREAFVLLVVWAVALYVISRSGGDITVVALGLTVASFVALAGGAGIEAIAMRKSWTFAAGCLVLAVWGSMLPFVHAGGWLVVPGLVGLAIVAATPGESRARDAVLQREFLTGRPRWSLWRPRLRRALVVGMILGIGITVLTGLWNSIASA